MLWKRKEVLKINNLYERDTYLDKSISYICNREIVEYDITRAGFNLTKYFKLLPDDVISELESAEKHKQHIAIGLHQRNNPEYKEALKSKFVEIRKMFFESNGLTNDDILSVKKDAIITLKRCHNLKFGNIEFTEELFTSYYYINKKELYCGDGQISLKGISNDKLELHKDYMLKYLYKTFKMLETSEHKRIAKSIIDFIDKYKNYGLDTGYYRELNDVSKFRYIGGDILLDEVDEYNLNSVDIRYNYINYIVPLLNLII